jgi:ribosomal protein L37AE/L43A
MKTLAVGSNQQHRCPMCGSRDVRRSQMRGLWERALLKTVGVKAYRCECCDARYYGHGETETKRQMKSIEPGENRDNG